MKNIKNAVIAVLLGLLALSLFTKPAQSATKTYDAVKLIQFDNCLKLFNSQNVGVGSPTYKGYPELYTFHLDICGRFLRTP